MDVRARFPIFERLTYINSCSQGALSDAVRAAYETYLADWDEHGSPWELWVELQEAEAPCSVGGAVDDLRLRRAARAVHRGVDQPRPVRREGEPIFRSGIVCDLNWFAIRKHLHINLIGRLKPFSAPEEREHPAVVQPHPRAHVIVAMAANQLLFTAIYYVGEILDRERLKGTLAGLFLTPCRRIT